MKKLISLIICLAMLLGCVCALAETAEKQELGTVNVNGAFKLQCAVPEGFLLCIVSQDSTRVSATLTTDDPTKPSVLVTVAFNEQYADIGRLNDVDEETLEIIRSSFSDVDEVTIEEKETSYGTKLLVVTENPEDGIAFADIYTIYKGYEIEFVLLPGTAGITEENIQMMVDFASNMDFVEV